jgi:hypothetical protein
MREAVVRITRESAPPRGNFVILVAYRKSLLSAKIKFIKAKMLYLTVYDDDNDDMIMMIILTL